MATTADAFQLAIAHHQAGRLREAEALYRQILQANPRHADALQLLGLLAHQAGQHEVAVNLIGRAILLRPNQPVFHCNLGEAYRALGKLTEATQCFRQALRFDPNLPEAHNNLGNMLRLTGQVDEARAEYEEAIRLRPTIAEAHNNLGTLLNDRGETDTAISHFRRAIELNPRYGDAYDSLGVALRAEGKLDEALECHLRTVELDPRNCQFHLNLGTLYQAKGQFESAAASYREALRLNPAFALARNNLGAALKEQGQLAEAIECYRESLRLEPDFAPAHFNLAIALNMQGDAVAAVAEYEQALTLDPDYAEALVNCGILIQNQGRLDEALRMIERAVALKPQYSLAHYGLGNVYKQKQMSGEAIAAYQEAVRLQPDFADAYNNLALMFNEIGQPDEAIKACHAGLAVAPEHDLLYSNLAGALHQQGRGSEAIAACRRSIELRPDCAAEHSNLLYALNFQADPVPAKVLAEHLAWAQTHAEPLTAQASPHANDRHPERRLRIGYVSPYFRQHAVNFFTEPILLSHDHALHEVFCYSDVRGGDAITARLRDAADCWRDTAYLTDEQLASQVRADAIDILVDLTGHIGGNRLLAFARKPAPVQVTYIGYQNTTGMSAMDYRLTDEQADPSNVTDPFYTERLVRLPRSFFCYLPSTDAPEVTSLPALSSGYVTFGSFNNFAKVTPRVIDAWLTILERVSDARLKVLASRGGYLERHLHALARSRGIEPERIELFDRRPRHEYLRLLAEVDVALDPFPLNGHTTTCDSIWMGLPVVMLRGQTYASRFGGSVLSNLGLEHLITESIDQYIERAAALASDLPALAELRGELRHRMASSVLVDFAGFTRNLEAAYREIWQAWCQSPEPKS